MEVCGVFFGKNNTGSSSFLSLPLFTYPAGYFPLYCGCWADRRACDKDRSKKDRHMQIAMEARWPLLGGNRNYSKHSWYPFSFLQGEEKVERDFFVSVIPFPFTTAPPCPASARSMHMRIQPNKVYRANQQTQMPNCETTVYLLYRIYSTSVQSPTSVPRVPYSPSRVRSPGTHPPSIQMNYNPT